jgi:hypothetical protein
VQVGVRRVVVRILATVMGLGAVVLGLAAAGPASAGTTSPAATAVRLVVEPGQVLEPHTPTTFRATVTPSAAQGTVAFRQAGAVVGTAVLVGGQAVLERNHNPAGSARMVAEFVPVPDGRYLTAVSPPVDLVVADIPRIVLTRPDGSIVSYGGAVPAGSLVRIQVSGFPAGARIGLLLGAQSLPTEVVADPDGAGRADVVVPSDAPARAYLVVAAGGLRSAVHKVTVLAASSPSPTTTPASSVSVTIPAPGSTPSPTPTPSPSSTSDGDGGGQIPSTGGERPSSAGELPRTGGDPLAGLLVAGLLLVAGVGLTALGSAGPRPAADLISPGTGAAPTSASRHPRARRETP